MKQRTGDPGEKKRRGAGGGASAAEKEEERPAARPLRRRPVLFGVLWAVLAIWVGLLVWMYFATVYPRLGAPLH